MFALGSFFLADAVCLEITQQGVRDLQDVSVDFGRPNNEGIGDMATVDRWLLPDGIEEVLPPEAARIETARRHVLDLFQRWGYELVITPHIEFLDSLLIGSGQDLDLKTFKVTDPLSGRQMGLRADITPQVARLDAHTLRGDAPSRLCYAGSVLHAHPRALSTSRSPIQLGAELYGERSVAADLEVMGLMIDMLQRMEVTRVHLDVGHVGVYRGLVNEAKLSESTAVRLFDAIQRKDEGEVRELTEGLPASLAAMLRALLSLYGGADVLPRARQLLADAPACVRSALDDLELLAAQLAARYPQLPLYFDLGELRGYHYHTGVVFAAFVLGVGEAIAQGGRYDDIGAAFGRARPATGFSTDLKTLVGLGEINLCEEKTGVWAPLDDSLAWWQAVSRLRTDGQRVVQGLKGQTLEAAREVGCDRQLIQRDGQWQVVALGV